MASSIATILILLLAFQSIFACVNCQQFESDVLGLDGNIIEDTNFDLIKQVCNLLDNVELIRTAEDELSTDHQAVIEVGEALKSTMQTWLDGFPAQQAGEQGTEDRLAALCVRATAAVKATNL
ncbi:uncharacterized protein LOC135332316 [Halichondria panicea]|uniref:uncharacterized protein LOC135332316 n=1 Tax=Halichondria panicea TaxID=6063 RepID=UPI00312B7728